MLSRTKTQLEDTTIRTIFEKHGIKGISEISPLGAGEFNAVYLVRADRDYVLKVAPDNEKVMTHEQDMIKSEVHWYQIMHEQTDIRCPQVFFTDFSKTIIPQNYFVMERIDGTLKGDLKLTEEENLKLNNQIAGMMASLHKVKNDRFGYIQTEQFDNWYDAFRNILKTLISDCRKIGETTVRGERLLALTEKYRDALLTVNCQLVNADGWDANFIAVPAEEGYRLFWIDPERNLWGDKIMDLICVDFGHDLKDKIYLEEYNRLTDEPIGPTRAEEIRFGFAIGWLALVMEVEKYYRYSPDYEGWNRNIESTNQMYERCFTILNEQM